MSCIFTGSKALAVVNKCDVGSEPIKFAGFLRDKLNIEQRGKIAKLLEGNRAKIDKTNYVSSSYCLKVFVKRWKDGEPWHLIKDSFLNELIEKGLINENDKAAWE